MRPRKGLRLALVVSMAGEITSAVMHLWHSARAESRSGLAPADRSISVLAFKAKLALKAKWLGEAV
jgi:hypothetical protein